MCSSDLGDFGLHSPSDLLRLLVSMTRNKLASATRLHRRRRRDVRRTVTAGDLDRVAGRAPDPTDQAMEAEMLDRLRSSLSEEERLIAAMRIDGVSWEEVAGRLGGAADARRRQYGRAIERARRRIEESNDGD